MSGTTERVAPIDGLKVLFAQPQLDKYNYQSGLTDEDRMGRRKESRPLSDGEKFLAHLVLDVQESESGPFAIFGLGNFIGRNF